MIISVNWFSREVAFGLVIMMAMPFTEAAAASPKQVFGGQQAESVPSAPSEPQSSGSQTVKAEPEPGRSDETLPNGPSSAQSQSSAPAGQPLTSQPAGEQMQEVQPKPVGSAAAPFERTTGVAASMPAGAVIAPAKQRRARSFIIKISVVVGACVAIGTVAALSHTSPSQPH